MRALLAQMERTESIAALVESLRGIIRTEREVNDLIERLRAEQGEGVFDPPGGRDDGRNR